MGPNALPVPVLLSAEFHQHTILETGIQQHLSKGDKTFNLVTDLHFPIIKDKAALKLYYNPIEFYKTDSVTRDLRAARDYQTNGYSFGDLLYYFP